MSIVGVIVPIYNAGSKLNKCIQSILDQSFDDFEVLLVNDGSTDNSLKICNKFKEKDKRIKLINQKNQGCIAARRTGIDNSNSDYLMFVDADDWIDKAMIELLYNEAITNNSDVVVCNSYKVLGEKTIIKQKNESNYFKDERLYNEQEIIDELIVSYLHGHAFPANLFGKLYKRELLKESGNFLNNIHFFGEDLYFNLEVFLKANSVKVIDQPLYYYRAGGTTSKYMSYLFDDMVNGYEIQKSVIREYFQNSKEKRYNGISVMLLNTLKTCVTNLFYSSLNKTEKRLKIYKYLQNASIRECIKNQGCLRYFEKDFLEAIEKYEIDYFYKLGENAFKKEKSRKIIIRMLSKVC